MEESVLAPKVVAVFSWRLKTNEHVWFSEWCVGNGRLWQEYVAVEARMYIGGQKPARNDRAERNMVSGRWVGKYQGFGNSESKSSHSNGTPNEQYHTWKNNLMKISTCSIPPANPSSGHEILAFIKPF